MPRRKKSIIFGVFLAFVLALVMGFQVLNRSGGSSAFLFSFFFNKNIDLKNENNHVNVLLLGIGGSKHEGPNLTDTMILANIDKKQNKVVLNSIPRDLWVPDIEGLNKKINVAYAQGENKRKGGGITLTKAIIKKVTGQDVNYVVVISFSGFVKAVDSLGGLDINVDRTLNDNEYPVEGKEADPCGKTDEELKILTQEIATGSAKDTEVFPCRFKTIHFDKGLNHMNGETALEFVRSRHASGEEGTDFARSKRQEKAISAFKDKILSAQTILNPARMIGLYSIISGSINTDINQNELDDFAKLAQGMSKAKIESSVIDAGDEVKGRPGLLEYDVISSLSVLIPRVGNGNFSEIKSYVSCEITKGNCVISQKPHE